VACIGNVSSANFCWLNALCIFSLAAWIAAMRIGSGTFHNSMRPFFELQQLNVYDSVDPSTSTANQYMDYGIINFDSNASIDRMYSMSFKNDDTYCVAPITIAKKKAQTKDQTSQTKTSSSKLKLAAVSHKNQTKSQKNQTKSQKNQTEAAVSTQRTYDYWAVGTNCCSHHLFDFDCGEWNNPAAHSGLRVLDETSRSYYMLAVQQAAAAYDIPVEHPVFMYWVQRPQDQILGYKAESYFSLGIGTFYTFFLSLLGTILLSIVYMKM
jgi:hypothetical protein